MAELQERYNKTREIHKLLSRTLADLPSPKQTRADLRKLVDLVRRTISSLKATKQYDLDSFLSSLVFSVLPSRLQTSWAQNTKKERGVPPVGQLLTFLREHAETLPANSPAIPTDNSIKKTPPRKNDRKQDPHPARSKSTVHSVSPASSYRWDCNLCAPEKHPLHLCPKWATLTLSQRLGHVQAKSLCSNCLAGGHSTSACKSLYRCRDCGQPHHTPIHQTPSTTSVNSSNPQSQQLPDALLTTAQVLLLGPNGEEIKARALIDSGAGLSLVSRRVAQILNLPMEPARLQLSAVQGELSKPLKHITHLHISPLLDRQKRISCKPAVTPTVTMDLPTAPIYQVGDLPHIMGLQLADPDYYNPGRIDILLGADMAPKIMSKTLLRNGAEAEPIAQATLFGWVLSGPVTRKHSSQSAIATNHIQAPPPEEEPLADSIFRLWASEEPEQEQPPISVLEQQVEKHFTDTVMYLPKESRYQITLPKTSATEELGASRPQALSRYLSNERSIQRRGIWEPFQQVIQGYFDLHHAELVPAEEQLNHPNFYLPMHAVLKDSSTSTKLRVVFDGSATTTSGLSLNQTLLVGPTLQPTLSTTLIKFRCYPIALNADISKMYREVKLSPADKDLHRFLWRASPNLPVQDCRMTRVTFGVSASPYLAVRALLQTADDHGEEYSKATQHIKQSFYVDDFLGGADTPQEAVLLFHQMRGILERGGFNLCKWRSSSSTVLQQIPASLQEEGHLKDVTSPNTPTQSKALGLQWDSRQDSMSPSIVVCGSYRSTKRGLISDVSKTYDILGWICPAVLSMKLLFQQLWKTGHDWDEPVPQELLSLHSKWRSELPALAKKQLPRCYTLYQHQVTSKTLHGFSDASKLAYGAVVYSRTTYQNHPPVISLVTAKTKVATLKPTTIPRLELCGAVLLTRLLKHTASILQIPAADWHAWSDSAIVLA